MQEPLEMSKNEAIAALGMWGSSNSREDMEVEDIVHNLQSELSITQEAERATQMSKWFYRSLNNRVVEITDNGYLFGPNHFTCGLSKSSGTSNQHGRY